ncbi:MAG: hypothetical protein ACFFA6_15110 [Promethearchaeota archaeon]
MNEIVWIYIIDSSGATIFSYNNYVQGNSEVDSALLSHFVYALLSVAKNIGEDEIKKVAIDKNKFFLIKEKLTSYIFILKTKPNAKFEIIEPILKKIKKRFIEKFTGHFTLPVQDKLKLLKSFEQDVKRIIEGKNHLIDLVDTLSKKN